MSNDKVTITKDAVGALPQAINEMRNMREVYNELVESIPKEADLKQRYSARFEQNQDGQDTCTVVLPIVAGVEESESGNSVIITI